jgi:hypothetical protein
MLTLVSPREACSRSWRTLARAGSSPWSQPIIAQESRTLAVTRQFLSPISRQISQEIGTFEAPFPLPPIPGHRFPQDHVIAFNSHRQAGALAQPQLISDLFGEGQLSSRGYTGFQHGLHPLSYSTVRQNLIQDLCQVASAVVIMDAKDDSAARFYKKYGFIGVPKTPNRLFLPMATIEKLFS